MNDRAHESGVAVRQKKKNVLPEQYAKCMQEGDVKSMRCEVGGVAVAAALAVSSVVSAQSKEELDGATQDDHVDVIRLPTKNDSSSEPAPGSEPRSSIEEVIVTAQRREQNIQDVPISIAVFSPEQLANANITNASDLATYTPSLAANNRFGNDNATFTIRGFTQDARTTASVGVYFAEVVAPRGQSVQASGDGAGPGSFFDLQNVQVLKGPQGTLFGRNTTGGAVLLVPQRPTDTFEGYGEVTTGSYNNFRQQAVINLPWTETFRLRIGLDHNVRDGYLRNYTGVGATDFNDINYTTYRASSLWELSESLENYTIVQYADSSTHGNTAKLFACNTELGGALLGTVLGFKAACRQQLSNEQATGADGFYDVASTVVDPVSKIKEVRSINTTEWRIDGDLAAKNILAYAHLRTDNTSAIFGTDFPNLLTGREAILGASYTSPDFPVTSQETWVEELQFLGTAFNEKLDWQGGGYFENSRPDGYSGNIGASLINCEQATIVTDSPNCSDNTGVIPIPGLPLPLGGVQTFAVKTEYLNLAVFGQATYKIIDELHLTLGARYTWDKTSGNSVRTMRRFSPVGTPLFTTVTERSAQTRSEAPTGIVELAYKPNPLVMTYAKYVRGYRQGNVNLAAAPGIDTWDPEKVDSYEIGGKTQFGGIFPGRFNVSAFYNNLSNQQLQFGYVSADDGGTTAVFNAGKSTIKGVEIEAFFEVIRDLTAGVSYSFLDTKLVSQDDPSARARAAGAIYTVPIADVGESLPSAPDHTVVTTLNYRLPSALRIGDIDIGATYVYTGQSRTCASSASPYNELPSFSLLNANIKWTRVFGSPVDLSLFGTNVLDKQYVTYVSGTYTGIGFDSRQVGQPRMFGARIRWSFGG